MANPKVRPHLSFYPEDAGNKLNEARQGKQWLHEIPDEQLTPMVRIGKDDFYTHELAMLSDQSCCMPIRWFKRDGNFVAICWKAVPVDTDRVSGWRIMKAEQYEVMEKDFLKPFPELHADAHRLYGLPDPANIIGQLIKLKLFLLYLLQLP